MANHDIPVEPSQARSRRNLRTWAAGAAGLVGVAGLAITQPVLDVFGRNPEFFIAGRYRSPQVVAFGLVVALVPSAIAVAGATLAWIAHPRLGAIAHGSALAAFAFLFGLVLANHVGVGPAWLAVSVAALLAIAVVWLQAARSGVRTLLSYLALGNVAFLAMFLFVSPTAELIGSHWAGDEVGAVRTPALEGPVVLVILDELPLTTLIRGDGTINEERYPNFARLASTSSWFRNAASTGYMTNVVVPSMLTGVLPAEGALPSYEDYPRNYFTAFGDRYPVNRYEAVTDMCPPSVCDPPPAGSLEQALRDSAVVYGHQVLPDPFAEDLPSVDHAWGGFADQVGTGEMAGAPTESPESALGDDGYGRWNDLAGFERSALGQFNAMGDTVAQIDAGASVNLIHVTLPHYPWTLTPWGVRLSRVPDLTSDPTDPAFPLARVQGYQLHALQVGAADVAVGRMIDHLEAVGAWEDALVVVTSDHGTSLLPPDLGRKVTDRNREQVLRVPLFIKAPGQTSGEVRDDPALTVDIFPSMLDLLDARSDWDFDGHSLYDGSEAQVERTVSDSIDAALAVAERQEANFAGDDWEGLAATGEHRDLIGRSVSEIPAGSGSALRWRAADEPLFASLPTDDGFAPYMITGEVRSTERDRPPELLVAVNGTLAGVLGAYVEDGDRWIFTGVVGPYFVDGANTVEAYEVETTPHGPVLHAVDHL